MSPKPEGSLENSKNDETLVSALSDLNEIMVMNPIEVQVKSAQPSERKPVSQFAKMSDLQNTHREQKYVNKDLNSQETNNTKSSKLNKPFKDRRRAASATSLHSVKSEVQKNSQRLRRIGSVSGLHDISYHPSATKHKIEGRNGNMVLQLVLPSSTHSEGYILENNNYLTSSSLNDVFYANLKRRTPRDSLASTGSEQDFYNRGVDIPNANINPSFSSCDVSELGRPNEGGLATHNGSESGSSKVPSTTEEKNRMFREYLTKILSCIYAVFIVTLGLVVYISDIIVGNSPIAETFSMYLVVIAFVYIMFLIIDIRIHLNKKKIHNSLLVKNQTFDDIEFHEYPEGSLHFSIPLPSVGKLQKPLAHHYCFSKGRHSGSFYLKLGAAGFCLGHLIHSGLLLGYQIVFLTSESDTFYECASVATLVLDIIYPIYSFLLLYFIFKYSNVIINRRVALARFAFMHCISSSLCFWVWTILRETMDALSGYKTGDDHNESDSSSEENGSRMSETSFFVGDDQPLALPLTTYNKRGAKELVKYLNGSLRISFGSCDEEEGLSLIYQNYSPYLYPFSVEYSILVVGILFIIWQNIADCKQSEGSPVSSDPPSKECNVPDTGNEESNLVIHADCHSANRGLFGGIVVFVVCVVTIILYFIAISDERYINLALFVIVLTDIILLVFMTATGICAYRQITKLDVNSHAISLLDDLLLFVCIPAFFLSAIFSIVPALQSGSILSVVSVSVKVLQMLVQTPLIIDGLRRCSNSRELRQQKPGRELITFLIVCNVSMWITQTFEIKSHGLQDHRYDFYGKVLWTILGHMTLPLMMFYRFHSSVCLVDIWKSAYEPEGH